jgi:hypothetical protein
VIDNSALCLAGVPGAETSKLDAVRGFTAPKFAFSKIQEALWQQAKAATVRSDLALL